MKEELFQFAFSNFLGVGPVKFKVLLKFFGSAEKAFNANKGELSEVLGQQLAEKFCQFREKFDPKKEKEKVISKGIKIIPQCSKEYPEELLRIEDPPICLYIKSENWSSILKHPLKFAIVGTRKPSEYGLKTTRLFAKALAKANFIIVSGMAIGIDTQAHKTALENNQKTIAVLGCGVDIVYPAINRKLYETIIKNGAVISEFPPGTMVQKGLFIARNRIISALSRAVLVVEGKQNSGALITARYAVEQGKDVFAVPGQIDNPNSYAPNSLIQKGAYPVLSTEDLLEQFKSEITVQKAEELPSLSSEEKLIIQSLQENPLHPDELSLKTNIPINKLMPILTLLEINNLITKEPDGKIALK